MDNYKINQITAKDAKAYIHKYHYSHGSHNAPSPCYGLFDGYLLIGVLMVATPCSENVRRSIFGDEYKQTVTELHRLHIQDGTPKNTESWFISRCLKLLRDDKPQIKALVSFSDSTAGHNGTIYKATNAYYYGKSVPATFYIDQDGRLRHPRQNGINITKSRANELGWISTKRQAKYRYFWLLCGNVEKKFWIDKLKVKILPYEKEA